MRLDTEYLVQRYKDDLYAAAFSIVKSREDAEDIAQETFLRYWNSDKQFESEAHIKAWLLRVAINRAKNTALSFWRRNRVSYEDYMAELTFETEEDRRVLDAVLALPQKYRIVVHLYYYEGYSVREIAAILSAKENTVKTRLARGRRLLKTTLTEVWNENE
ncbi:MAG: sigma-70 family RNA polymerase sigma factor [Clostridia bacterium]|nr:sigma-70 family RNA polymerase sigma factor [Clostridia bacterium]